MYSPGFYVNHIEASNEHLVYVFDTEEPLVVDYHKLRQVDAAHKLQFDQDNGMTLVRELFFLREDRDQQRYCKFQVGDEVKYRLMPYVVVKIDQSTVWIKDKENNIKEVDPQALTAGPRDHWRAQEASHCFAPFTFTRGDFAYRPVRLNDAPPTNRANGVLCVIKYYNGSVVELIDCWTGEVSTESPNVLVKPSYQVRKLLDNSSFHTFRKRVLDGFSAEHCKISHEREFEGICWGYDMLLDFKDTTVYSADKSSFKPVTSGPVSEVRNDVKEPPAPVKNKQSDTFWAILGTIVIAILIL